MVGVLIALISSVFFGANHAAARRGLLAAEVYPSVLWTLVLGVPMFAGVAAATGQLPQIAAISVLAWLLLASAGAAHFVIGRTLTYASLQAIGAGQASPIIATNTLYTAILGILLLGEPATLKVVISAVLVTLGVLLVSRQDPAAQSHAAGVGLRGVTYAGIAGFIFGITPLLIRAASVDAPYPALNTFVSYLVALLLFATPLLRNSRRRDFGATLPRAIWVAAVMVNLGQLLRYYALALAPASLVAPVVNAFPLFAIGITQVANRGMEPLTKAIVAGALLIFIGVSAVYLLPD